MPGTPEGGTKSRVDCTSISLNDIMKAEIFLYKLRNTENVLDF